MEITFIPFESQKLLEPIPAIKKLPSWYKNISAHIEGKLDKFDNSANINETIKRCNPVGDALNFGYFILLESSINVTKEKIDGKTQTSLNWLVGGKDFVTTHSKDQYHKDLVPEGFSNTAYKFKNFYGIKTPKGYSTLFTHPLNRPELPFYTLQGVVDTDLYHNSVQFPFFLKKDFEGIIEAGTPIAQVIPFKREPWSSFVTSPDLEKFNNFSIDHNKNLIRWYKNKFWSKKEFK